MNYRIESRGEMRMIGRELRVTDGSQVAVMIPKFWDDCVGQGFFQTVGSLPNRAEDGAVLGWMDDYDPATGAFSYIVGVEVKDFSTVPEGWVQRTKPASTYFVGIAQGQMPQAIQETAGQVESGLREAGYERAGGWEFEYYGPDYDEGKPDCRAYYWVPAKKVTA